MSSIEKVAFLGLGAMGARMATHLHRAGVPLRVWSRSGAPTDREELVACQEPTAEAAARDANVVFAMVSDDAASRELWLTRGVLSALSPSAIAVECSTLSAGWVDELANHAQRASLGFVAAPVVGSRPQADAGTLQFLVGGLAEHVERLRPLLLTMGAAVHLLGPPRASTLTKLAVNALLASQVAVLAELLGWAQREKIDVDALLRALQELPVTSPAGKAAAASMRSGSYEPMFPLDLACKDLRYAIAEAERTCGEVPLVRRTSELFERARAQGHGDRHLTVVAKLYEV